jgi:hypothetical protein
MYQTCVLHPVVAHAEPYLQSVATSTSGVDVPTPPAADVSVGNHSHVVDVRSSPARWWVATVVVVTDPSIWPDADGRCTGSGCLTSVAAIRAAQRAGRARADIPTNVWFLFSVRPVAL